ncbi:hypothetical protein [Dickeya phage Amaethon]|nr:hypothetical protein [Dickeya phage Amaethon]
MQPRKTQVEVAEEALSKLRQYGLAYLAMEERTGKTLAALLTAELSNANRILVITKKNPKESISETLAAWEHTKYFRLTTYHSVTKIPISTPFDMVILDEAHNYISAFPKPGKIWKDLRPYCAGKPILYLSATPHAQSLAQLYHQFALCSWSPWIRYPTFYAWHNVYGKPYTIELNNRDVNQYDRTDKAKVMADVQHLFITKTRAEIGFKHEPEDCLHFIEPSEPLKQVYNTILKDSVIKLSVGKLVCDSKSKLRTSLHQLEGGTIIVDDKRHVLANTEKVDYILEKWGDVPSLVIMYNFQAEKVKLEKYFKQATILQATSFAEGIDLYQYDTLVIYSQDYSTARHTQRRARQANMARDKPITVHFLLMKKGISAQVYKSVSINKRNYVDSVFNKEFL